MLAWIRKGRFESLLLPPPNQGQKQAISAQVHASSIVVFEGNGRKGKNCRSLLAHFHARHSSVLSSIRLTMVRIRNIILKRIICLASWEGEKGYQARERDRASRDKSKLPTVGIDIYSADMKQPKRNRKSQVEKLSNYVDVDTTKGERARPTRKSNTQRNCINSERTALSQGTRTPHPSVPTRFRNIFKM